MFPVTDSFKFSPIKFKVDEKRQKIFQIHRTTFVGTTICYVDVLTLFRSLAIRVRMIAKVLSLILFVLTS